MPLASPSRPVDGRTHSLAEIDLLSAERRLRWLPDSQQGIVDATAVRLGLPVPPLFEERLVNVPAE
jgi:hypothetical protein